MSERRYDRTGLLAVDPQAFDMVFGTLPSRETVDVRGVPVLTIRGPLEHHAGMWCDNYDAILARASEALGSAAPGIVLRIDSPGGLVSGCMETARAIRALADGSGKRVIAYADGKVCSAAYALASVADTIVAPESAELGSIGVLASRRDASAALEREGLRLYLVTSGARKGDGDPHVPVSEDELAALQETVDTLSEMFFAHVAAHRPVSVDDVRNLQAATLHGARAVAAGLADVLGDLDHAVALALGETQQAAARPSEDAMASNLEEGLAKLRKAAEGDDEEAKKARRMLAAMDEDEGDEPGAEGGDDEPDAKATAASAEDEAPPPKDDGEDDESSAKAIAAQALATAQRAERAQILATRPDLSAEALENLSGVPNEALASVLKTIPRVMPAAPKAAAPTRGEGQGPGSTGTEGDIEAVNRRLGISDQPSGVVRTGSATTYHAPEGRGGQIR